MNVLIGQCWPTLRAQSQRFRIWYHVKSIPNFNTGFPSLKLLHEDPSVYQIDNFLSEEQCDSIIDIAQQKGELVTTSRTYLLHKNETSAQSSLVRNSMTWYVDFSLVDELCNKVSSLTGHSVSTFEEPQVVRYLPGQYYSWHQDAIPRGKVNMHAGNRLATVIIYLNTVKAKHSNSDALDTSITEDSCLNDEGNLASRSLSGCTSFKELELHVRPVKGRCLVFFPCFNNGTPDPRTVHCSQPVDNTDGAKWIAQIWVHQRPYLV